jgi:hypothetical protein
MEVRKMRIEEMVKKTELVPVARWDLDETRIYDERLFEMWRAKPKEIVYGPEREAETETEAGHYVMRIYKNPYGCWLYKTWIPHFGYSWEEDRLYYLPDFCSGESEKND